MLRITSGLPVSIDSASDVRRICPPPSPREPSMSTGAVTSALHAYDLLQLVNDLDEIGLRFHHLVDRLVRHRRLVDHALVLAALDALGGGFVIRDREATL